MGSVYSITGEAEEALAAATAETVLQLVGHASVKARIVEWGVSFDGVSAVAEPIRIRLVRQTTAGTATGASEVMWDPDNPTASCLGFHSFSAEPTYGDILVDMDVHPQAGIVMQYPLGREPVIDNSTTSRLGLVVTAPAIVNAAAWLAWEE